MSALAVASEPIVPFGWQDGNDGFLVGGMGEPYVHGRPWEDMYYEGVFAGRFAGKSHIGAVRELLYVQAHPGSTNLIAAPDYTTIRRGTLPALEKVFNSQQLYRGRDYDFNKTDMEISYLWKGYGGTKSILVSLDDKKAGRSIRAASVWLDEAGYVEWESFQGLQPTMTQVGYPHQMWMTSTPVGKFHWTYGFYFPREAFDDEYTEMDIRDYILEEMGSEYEDRKLVVVRDPDKPEELTKRVCMFASTRDNPHGGEREWRQMRMLYGPGTPLFTQEAEGRFTVQQGLVYPGWSAKQFMVARTEWPTRPKKNVAAIDFGWESPTAILVGGCDDAGRVYLQEEFYRPHFPLENLANVCKHLMRKYHVHLFFVDAADARSKAYLRAAGIPVWNAEKDIGKPQDIGSGIGLFTWVLGSRIKDGTQRLYVDPSLHNFRAEIENYVKHEQVLGQNPKEVPKKRRDHLMDCGRYLFSGMRRLGWLNPRRERAMNFDMRFDLT